MSLFEKSVQPSRSDYEPDVLKRVIWEVCPSVRNVGLNSDVQIQKYLHNNRSGAVTCKRVKPCNVIQNVENVQMQTFWVLKFPSDVSLPAVECWSF